MDENPSGCLKGLRYASVSKEFKAWPKYLHTTVIGYPQSFCLLKFQKYVPRSIYQNLNTPNRKEGNWPSPLNLTSINLEETNI